MKRYIRKTSLLLLMALITFYAGFAQENNWHNQDYIKDGVYGISINRAYDELLQNKTPDTVIVAVIDNGMDTSHEDLTTVLWHNAMEGGNDEDNNGYRGDVHGWNFLGGADGQNIYSGGLEYQRVYFNLRNKYPNKIPKKEKMQYKSWLQAKKRIHTDSLNSVSSLVSFKKSMVASDSTLRKILNRREYSYSDLLDLGLKDKEQENIIGTILSQLKKHPDRTNVEYLDSIGQLTYSLPKNPTIKRSEIVKDDYKNFKDRFYGNNDLKCNGTSAHGTHVAGIIGAKRDNGKGMDGVANAVKLMAVRVVPASGDEYDKDVALAIRYAVDNGAKVINMSFGKPFSPEQKWVEKAIRYAARKDVLVVNAAGNDRQNTDDIPFYPTAKYINGKKRAPNMITVGASGPTAETFIASFSNYGQQTVDVFAPGLQIYASLPDNRYGNFSGTSMASPVVAGLAAVLRSHYPKLSAKQVKYIIENSVTKIDFPVTKPGIKEQVPMTELCRTGGIVNAFNAVKLAEEMTKKKKKVKNYKQ